MIPNVTVPITNWLKDLKKGGVVTRWTVICLYGFFFKKLKNCKKNWIHIRKTTQIKTDYQFRAVSYLSCFFMQKKRYVIPTSHIKCCYHERLLHLSYYQYSISWSICQIILNKSSLKLWLIENNKIKMTIPNQPKNKNQKYVTILQK